MSANRPAETGNPALVGLDVEKVRVSTWWSRWAPWVGMVGAVVAAAVGLHPLAAGLAIASAITTYLPRLFKRRFVRRLRRDAVVEVRLAESQTKGTVVQLRTADHATYELRFATIKELHAYLARLGLDRRRLSVVYEPELRRIFTGLFYWIGGPAAYFSVVLTNLGGDDAVWAPAVVLPFFAMVPAATAVVSHLRRLVIGADGVRIGRKFLPAKDIETVASKVRWEIVVTTKDGREHVVTIGTSTDDRAAWLVECIRAVARDPLGDGESLARGGRDLTAWRKALESKVRAGYREGALTPGQLERVLDDPSAAPDRRLGAALALLAVTPEAKQPALRVRIAELGEATADDRLARAFEELAADALTPRAAERVREA
ncbi:MAG: hypothetical protein H6722_11715 [Sandaracinus sp.]|nr:hypothetical protein [Sandaracinus sp.]MCB9613111.1 hypothetical protein [Sandaracinus sp.]